MAAARSGAGAPAAEPSATGAACPVCPVCPACPACAVCTDTACPGIVGGATSRSRARRSGVIAGSSSVTVAPATVTVHSFASAPTTGKLPVAGR